MALQQALNETIRRPFQARELHHPSPAQRASTGTFPRALRKLRKGEHLCRAGDRMQHIYRVRAGILKSYRVGDEGEEHILGFHLAGNSFGFDSLDTGRATCGIMALDSTSVEVISLAVLNDDMSGSGALRDDLQGELLVAMSREVKRLARMLQMERCSAEQRVSGFLLEHAAYEHARGCCARDFVLPMSRRDIARHLHLATETLSRVFSRLQRLGLLTVERNHITLHDAQGLREVVDSVACERE